MNAAFTADEVNGNDVLMLQVSGGLGFILEALELAGVQGASEPQDLEGDSATQRDLLGFVDEPMPPRPISRMMRKSPSVPAG